MSGIPNSPYSGGPKTPLEELFLDGDEFAKWLQMPRDSEQNYRDEDQYRKDPDRAGLPGEQI